MPASDRFSVRDEPLSPSQRAARWAASLAVGAATWGAGAPVPPQRRWVVHDRTNGRDHLVVERWDEPTDLGEVLRRDLAELDDEAFVRRWLDGP